jgi:hypothetical protein
VLEAELRAQKQRNSVFEMLFAELIERRELVSSSSLRRCTVSSARLTGRTGQDPTGELRPLLSELGLEDKAKGCGAPPRAAGGAHEVRTQGRGRRFSYAGQPR